MLYPSGSPPVTPAKAGARASQSLLVRTPDSRLTSLRLLKSAWRDDEQSPFHVTRMDGCLPTRPMPA